MPRNPNRASSEQRPDDSDGDDISLTSLDSHMSGLSIHSSHSGAPPSYCWHDTHHFTIS
jgi:hypothetical protein